MHNDHPVRQLATRSTSQQHDAWRDRLAPMTVSDQHDALSDLIAGLVVAIADGHESPTGIDRDAPWRKLGIYRNRADQLRDELRTAVGLHLPATLFFDHPTPAALAGFVRAEILGIGEEATAARAHGLTTATGVDPIAIVSMACRLPGGADTPEALWDLVRDGRDVVGDFPDNRGWDLESLYDPDPAVPGTVNTRHGGFLPDVDLFDPGFFGIGPREANALDPQQRLMLEITWEVLERAGIDPQSLRGGNTGVFSGVSLQDYGPRWAQAPAEAQGHLLTGIAVGLVAGRIAYNYGFEGPTLSVETQCSASLTALHLAGQALRTGECDLALAGGVTVMSTPSMLLEFSMKRGLSPDGRCKAFSSDADGTGWADGAGVLLLERLSDARRNGHPVLALLRGTAINQDGASNGLTAPNGGSQQRLIRQALANAGLSGTDVDAVEAHGTGTSLGDPIEAKAIIATYGKDRPADQPLYLGSLKSNIGHAQAAAGVGGVIKMVQAMRHGVLPKTLHIKEPSPHADWESGNVHLLTETTPWPRREGERRRAGVSAFGVSGTNAHVVLEEAPDDDVVAPGATADPTRSAPVPVALSARTEGALRAQAARLAAHLGAHPTVTALDTGFTQAGRARFEHRALAVAGGSQGGTEQLAKVLTALAEGRPTVGLVTGSARLGTARGKLAFLFTGQGSQRAEMGRALYGTYPTYARALDDVFAAFEPHLERPLRDVLFAPAGSAGAAALDRTEYTQPGLFAFETALFRLLASWGVTPDLLIGHSIGELTAAHVAGVWSLDDAAQLVAARGRLMQACPEGGAMIAIGAGAAEVRQSLNGFDGKVEIATINGPGATVIAGDAEAAEQVATGWTRRGRNIKRLTVSHAFHSPHMDGMLDEFWGIVAGVAAQPPHIPIVSNLTGELVTDAAQVGPDYWVSHVRRPVRFLDGLRRLHAEGVTAFLEVGPAAVLTSLVPSCVPETATNRDDLVTVAIARAGRPEPETMLAGLAELDVRGVTVDWRAVDAGRGGKHVQLPTYAFQRKRYWLDGRAPGSASPAGKPARVVDPAAWRYHTVWQPLSDDAEVATVTAAGASAQRPLSDSWLVVTPARGVEDKLIARLAWFIDRLGGRAVHVPVPDGATDRQSLAALVTEQLPGDRPLGGVLSLLALDRTAHRDHPAVTNGFALTCALAQALGDLELTAPLWCTTRGGVELGPDHPVTAPDQAMVWGLGRALALENPRGWGGLIDLPATLDDYALWWLGSALAGPGGEDQLAVRRTGLLVPRLVKDPSPVPAEPWRPRGTVLVTGGTGALGALVATWLAGAGASRLVLTSRRGAEAPGAAELTATLEALGAKVAIEACNMADAGQVADLLSRLGEDGDLPSAVFHAAGVSGPTAALGELSIGEIADVVAGKATGAALLDTLLADTELDAFVLFSSISATWGSGSQAPYSAGNAFLDGLASQRRARGLAATSVAFGPWADAGMGAETTLRDFLTRRGLTPLPPDGATTALATAVAAGETAVTVVDVDWARFLPAYTAARTTQFFDLIPVPVPAPATAAAPADGEHASAPSLDLAALPEAQRAPALRLLVRTNAAVILGYGSPEEIDPERRFLELGFDSLASVELSRRLAAATGLAVTGPVVFEHPTVTELTQHLLTLAAEQVATAATPAARPAPAPTGGGAGVRHMYRHACSIGKFVEGIDLLRAAAKLRPAFSTADEYGRPLEAIRLASGSALPTLVCVPAMVAPSGPHNFARLALHLHGRRDVYGLYLPGFNDGDLLPATSEVAIDMLADTVIRKFTGVPIALAGYSSGGWLAHAIASRLEQRGFHPEGIVLLDTWFPGDRIPQEDIDEELSGIAVNEQAFGLMTEAQVTAQGAYLDLFDGWRPTEVDATVVLVRAGERMPQQPTDEEEADAPAEAEWHLDHETLEVDGNHQTMMNQYADSTAQALHKWLDGLHRQTGMAEAS